MREVREILTIGRKYRSLEIWIPAVGHVNWKRHGAKVSEASKFNNETDKQALVEFQSHLSENSLASWNDSFAFCKWTGVTCGRRHKRVTGLDLSGMKLSGAISPSIGNLSFLTSLSLSGNSFHGSIPLEVGKLFWLQHLNMSSNVLGGGIPAHFLHLCFCLSE
ncbi:hypothetical protein Bca52824_039860 [Brassica carinata]|uniref:Leucine-rich repeat-containing N-terminal plant-type domain-containing protein n=1 Tax=Brassica carinata TaxID=52824 RepID=A0A8X7UXB0_BRACI|nr:hypothetical protein Bca52824_039860 [Brassica carinata]